MDLVTEHVHFLVRVYTNEDVQDARPESERATPLGVACDSH